MTVETATIFSQLNPDYPANTDLESEGAAHIRLIKDLLVDNLSTISGPLTVSHTDLNYVGQTQTTTDSSTKVASTACVDAKILAASLSASIPTQATNQGKSLKTDGTSVAWGFAGFEGYASKSSDYTVLASDANYVIDCTATMTLSLSSIATLKKCVFIVRNSGATTAVVTIDPDGAESIDGLTTFAMYSGEIRLFQCDGTTLRTYVLNPFYAVFTSSGSFTKPPGYSAFGGRLWAGGGSGRRDTGANDKTGGGGGGCAEFVLPVSAVGTTETVTIGAGGAAQTTDATNGNAGGTSTFVSVNAYGGSGGTATNGNGGSAHLNRAISTTGANQAIAGTTIVGGNNYDGLYGGAVSVLSGSGGNSVYGGGAGGSVTSADALVAVRTTVFGGVGGAAVVAGNGTSGTAPGGGGGATKSGTQSGAGARGELRVWGIV